MFFDVDVPDNDVSVCFLLAFGKPLRVYNPCHVSFADDVVSWFDKTRVNLPSVSYIKLALPKSNNVPQRLKCFCAVVSQYPSENVFMKMIYCCPQPNFVFFDPTKVSNSSNSPTDGISSVGGASGSFEPTCFTQLITVV